PFFLPLGIMSGLMSLIPYLGTALMAVFTSVISLATGGPWHAVMTAAYFILYGQFEGQVLSPIMYRRTVKVNPLIVLLSALFFVELAGIPGAIVAVPAAAAGAVLLREIFLMRPERPPLQAPGVRAAPPRREAEPSGATPPSPPPPLPPPPPERP